MAFRYPLTDSQRRIVALSADLADRLASKVPVHDRDCTFSIENLEMLHQAGYLRLALPREFGGEEADIVDLVLAQERLARGDAASALVVGSPAPIAFLPLSSQCPRAARASSLPLGPRRLSCRAPSPPSPCRRQGRSPPAPRPSQCA